MRFLRAIRAQHIALAILVVICLVVILVVSSNTGSDTPDGKTSKKSTPQTANEKPFLNAVQEKKLNKRVKAFAKYYFSVDPSLTELERQSVIAEYVTPDFLSSTSLVTERFVGNVAYVEAEPLTPFVGDSLGEPDKSELAGGVTMRYVSYDANNTVVSSYESFEAIYLVRIDGVWMIEDA